MSCAQECGDVFPNQDLFAAAAERPAAEFDSRRRIHPGVISR